MSRLLADLLTARHQQRNHPLYASGQPYELTYLEYGDLLYSVEHCIGGRFSIREMPGVPPLWELRAYEPELVVQSGVLSHIEKELNHWETLHLREVCRKSDANPEWGVAALSCYLEHCPSMEMLTHMLGHPASLVREGVILGLANLEGGRAVISTHYHTEQHPGLRDLIEEIKAESL